MKKAEAKNDDVVAVLMIGDPKYIQNVRRMVEEEAGIKIRDFPGWDSMLCFAEGAARYANFLNILG